MQSLDFLPNSPTLRNFGRNEGCGSACFVFPVGDSRRSIFKTLSDAVDVQAYGGGTGMSFSNLRPKGDHIRSTGGMASGPLSFMEIFDLTIGDIIKQGGTRDGANMGILRVDHPDIESFITSKISEGELKNFNLSVGVTDAFMIAAKRKGMNSAAIPATAADDIGTVSYTIAGLKIFTCIFYLIPLSVHFDDDSDIFMSVY